MEYMGQLVTLECSDAKLIIFGWLETTLLLQLLKLLLFTNY
jgi:hypothetical protein